MENHPSDPFVLKSTKKAQLGIFAESSSTPRKTAKDDVIRKRFRLLNTARGLLPDERISACQVKIAPLHDEVIVARSDSGRVSFQHLQRCESYSCPICAFKRAEEDRHQLSIALAEAKLRGYTPVLLTETIQHHAVDSLPDLQTALRQAHDKVFSGRWYQELKEEWKIIGKVASWETTYGRNGWHPHRHILLFIDALLSAGQVNHLTTLLKERWLEKLRSLGGDASWERGLDVRTADSAIAEYISKFGHEPLQKHWAVEHEITKGLYKQVRTEGLTPFDLLAIAGGDQQLTQIFADLVRWSKTNDLQRWAGKLYVQWFKTFKGKARIHWGDMWALLGMDEAIKHHENEAKQEPKEEFTPILSLPRKTWARICKFDDDMRSELVIRCQDATGDDLVQWLARRNLLGEVLIQAPPVADQICEPSTDEPLKQKSMFERSQSAWH